MHRSLRILTLILALICLAAVGARSASVDPNLPDTVRVDSVAVYQSGQGIVPVRFVNDEPLATAEITLKLGSVDLKIDSFSFVGGRVASLPLLQKVMSDDSSIVAVFFDVGAGAYLSTGSGLLGNLYVRWSSPITPQLVTIDSIAWITDVNVLHTTFFIDTLGADFTPQFRKGYLDILADPARPDSIWVAQVQGNIGSQVAVDVNLFNEKNLAGISLALTWESDRLVFDSVSYTGTRGESAPAKGLQKNNSAKQLLASIAYDVGAPLPPGSGVLTRLYFSIPSNAPETTVTIDSTNFLGTQSTFLLLTVADGAVQFTPIFHSGSVELRAGTDVNDGGNGPLPKTFSLAQNYPNPFNPSTQIQFDLPRSSQVRLEIYNILGAQVRTLIDGPMDAGTHRVTFDGKTESGQRLASGLYFYRLSAGDFTETKKMILLK